VTSPEPAAVYRRRRAVAAVVAVAVVALLALGARALLWGDGTAAAPAGAQAGAARPLARLPGGGRRIFPGHRVVAFYGAPQDQELGELGIGSPDSAARRLARQAEPYATRRRPVLPAMELITVLATADAGLTGTHSQRQSDATIGRYLRAARRAKALLLLDIQPGRSDFFTETTRLERWLREPDVGLALDPEWRVGPDQVPGKIIGRVDAREINATSAWLSLLVARKRLPQKLFVVHQFTDDMVDQAALKPRDGLAMVLNADGFGGRAVKRAKYHLFTRQAPHFNQGFKLFYREDIDLLTPRQVLRMRPAPDLVVYE
jgi:hypothetical protein